MSAERKPVIFFHNQPRSSVIVQQQNNSQRDTSPADPQGQETQHSYRNSSPIVTQRYEKQQSFRDNIPTDPQRHETQQSYRETKHYHQDGENQNEVHPDNQTNCQHHTFDQLGSQPPEQPHATRYHQSSDRSGRQLPSTERQSQFQDWQQGLKERKKDLSERQIEPSGRQLETSEKQLQSSGRQLETMGKQLESSGRQLEHSGRQLEPPGRQLDPSGRHLEPSGRQLEPYGGRQLNSAECHYNAVSESYHQEEYERSTIDGECSSTGLHRSRSFKTADTTSRDPSRHQEKSPRYNPYSSVYHDKRKSEYESTPQSFGAQQPHHRERSRYTPDGYPGTYYCMSSSSSQHNPAYPSSCNRSCCIPSPSGYGSSMADNRRVEHSGKVLQMASNSSDFNTLYNIIYKQAVADVCAGAAKALHQPSPQPPNEFQPPDHISSLRSALPVDSYGGHHRLQDQGGYRGMEGRDEYLRTKWLPTSKVFNNPPQSVLRSAGDCRCVDSRDCDCPSLPHHISASCERSPHRRDAPPPLDRQLSHPRTRLPDYGSPPADIKQHRQLFSQLPNSGAGGIDSFHNSVRTLYPLPHVSTSLPHTSKLSHRDQSPLPSMSDGSNYNKEDTYNRPSVLRAGAGSTTLNLHDDRTAPLPVLNLVDSDNVSKFDMVEREGVAKSPDKSNMIGTPPTIEEDDNSPTDNYHNMNLKNIMLKSLDDLSAISKTRRGEESRSLSLEQNVPSSSPKGGDISRHLSQDSYLSRSDVCAEADMKTDAETLANHSRTSGDGYYKNFDDMMEQVVFNSPFQDISLQPNVFQVKNEIEDSDTVAAYNNERPSLFSPSSYNTVDSAAGFSGDVKPDISVLDISPRGGEEIVRKRRRRRKSELETAGNDKRPISDCKVCGDQAIAHMHYGGICCYSCKAFFRRAVQSGKDKKYRCKSDGECSVAINNRRGCQKCRFQKCLLIGMVPSWVLSDEQCEKRFGKSRLKRKGGYPNIKTEVEEDDKEKVVASISTAEVSPRLQPLVSTRVLPEHLKLTDNDELNIEYMSCVYEASKEMISFSEENTELWNKLFQEKSNSKHNYSTSDLTALIQTVVKKNIFFLEANSYFKKLDFEDKRKLLRKNMSQMGQLRGALRFDNRDKTFNWYFNQKEVNLASDKHSSANQKIDQKDLSKFYKSEKSASGVMKVMERICRVGLTSEALMIMMHIVLFSTDGFLSGELNKPELIDEIQVTYFNLLHRYILSIKNQSEASIMMCKIMTLLVDLRELCQEADELEYQTKVEEDKNLKEDDNNQQQQKQQQQQQTSQTEVDQDLDHQSLDPTLPRSCERQEDQADDQSDG